MKSAIVTTIIVSVTIFGYLCLTARVNAQVDGYGADYSGDYSDPSYIYPDPDPYPEPYIYPNPAYTEYPDPVEPYADYPTPSYGFGGGYPTPYGYPTPAYGYPTPVYGYPYPYPYPTPYGYPYPYPYPTPAYGYPTPAYGYPTPSYGYPTPYGYPYPYPYPTPSYGYPYPYPYPTPGYGYPTPAYSYPTPAYGYPYPYPYPYPTPSYGYPTPGYGYPTPAYSYPTPSYGYPTPSYGYPYPYPYPYPAPVYGYPYPYPTPAYAYPYPFPSGIRGDVYSFGQISNIQVFGPAIVSSGQGTPNVQPLSDPQRWLVSDYSPQLVSTWKNIMNSNIDRLVRERARSLSTSTITGQFNINPSGRLGGEAWKRSGGLTLSGVTFTGPVGNARGTIVVESGDVVITGSVTATQPVGIVARTGNIRIAAAVGELRNLYFYAPAASPAGQISFEGSSTDSGLTARGAFIARSFLFTTRGLDLRYDTTVSLNPPPGFISFILPTILESAP